VEGFNLLRSASCGGVSVGDLRAELVGDAVAELVGELMMLGKFDGFLLLVTRPRLNAKTIAAVSAIRATRLIATSATAPGWLYQGFLSCRF
jgi:hypothetical protein